MFSDDYLGVLLPILRLGQTHAAALQDFLNLLGCPSCSSRLEPQYYSMLTPCHVLPQRVKRAASASAMSFPLPEPIQLSARQALS